MSVSVRGVVRAMGATGALAGAALALAPATAAPLVMEDASIIPLFVEHCTRGNVNVEAIAAGVTDAWTPVAAPRFNAEALARVPSQSVSGHFDDPVTVRQWQRTVNGREVNLAVATYGARSRYHHVCAVTLTGVRNAMPYLDAMDDAMKALKLSGRSTDLPHYREYSGRLADQRRARGDIFSRSQVVPGSNVMHLYIAFE